MRKFKLLVLLVFAIVISANAQNCNCETAFAWVKQTFEENDAGFQFVIDRRGEQAYAIHNQLIAERIKTATNNHECAEIITEWLHFFRTGHIGFRVLKDDRPASITSTRRFPDWERVDVDIDEFKKHLREKDFAGLQGIWLTGGSRSFGIKKADDRYVGFMLHTYGEWEKGQVRFRIYSDSVIYYLRDRSIRKFRTADLISKNFLVFDYDFRFIFFTRDYPKYEDRFLQSLSDRQPYLERLNETTLYLRIPSFMQQFHQAIDSVLLTNKDKVTQTENLIVDLRFNSGGSDGSWQKLMSLIATNPTRSRSVYLLSTELNNLGSGRTGATLDRMNNNLGEFVLLHSERFPIWNWGNTNEYPKQVGIIVDRYCASSTEAFLLMARQSRRVKLFGHPTAGVFDFSNMNILESPCGNFNLFYATSKNVGVDQFPIDGIGIQPDFFLDGIPGYKWVDFVNEVLNWR